MISAKFFWRRAFPSLLLVSTFLLLYEATVSDSRYAARQAQLLEGQLKPAPGTRLQFKATAYCKGQTTASGVAVRSGVVAADELLLPVGSVIQADFDMPAYNGVYTVMDTGPEVQGRELDVYMWSCFEALRFGRQDVHIVVLRLVWNPKDTTPLIESLFHRRLPGDTDEDARPSEPPRRPRPPRIPTEQPVTPLPNPTFDASSSDAVPASEPPPATP
jgi:3D (Asp-Asp-Asp) domain-containing protein